MGFLGEFGRSPDKSSGLCPNFPKKPINCHWPQVGRQIVMAPNYYAIMEVMPLWKRPSLNWSPRVTVTGSSRFPPASVSLKITAGVHTCTLLMISHTWVLDSSSCLCGWTCEGSIFVRPASWRCEQSGKCEPWPVGFLIITSFKIFAARSAKEILKLVMV